MKSEYKLQTEFEINPAFIHHMESNFILNYFKGKIVLPNNVYCVRKMCSTCTVAAVVCFRLTKSL